MTDRTSNERTLLDETRKLLRKMRDEHIADGSLTGRTQREGDRLLERIDVALATPETAGKGPSVRRGLMPVTEVLNEMREIAEDLYLSNKTTQAEDEAFEALFDAIAARFPLKSTTEPQS